MSLLRICVAVLALSLPLSARADGGIVSFVDAGGVLNLSNVAEDLRARTPLANAALSQRAMRESSASGATRDRSPRYRAIILQAADQHGIDAALLHAVIAVESAFNANAVSRRGAGGLMQLMPNTARRYGVADVFDPADNVRAGAIYLTELLKLFDNDLQLTLAAYNAGEGAVLKYGRRIPPYRETVAYVPKVIAAYDRYRMTL
jgi:soluble lytic murein transglycosylase-like protein